MPYDDTDVKKMIKYQTERKVVFSRHKKLSGEVKQLIHGILEASIDRRYAVGDIRQSVWMTPPAAQTAADATTSSGGGDSELGDKQLSDSKAAAVEKDSAVDDRAVNSSTDKRPAATCRPAAPTTVQRRSSCAVHRCRQQQQQQQQSSDAAHRTSVDCNHSAARPAAARHRPNDLAQSTTTHAAAAPDRLRANGR